MFKNLVETYLMPEPRGFTLIASRLKRGMTPLDIRNQLMEETGASRLKAGKLVEETQKAIQIAKINQFSGASLFAISLVILLFFSLDFRAVIGVVIGAAQFAAGREVWIRYKAAIIEEKVS